MSAKRKGRVKNTATLAVAINEGTILKRWYRDGTSDRTEPSNRIVRIVDYLMRRWGRYHPGERYPMLLFWRGPFWKN